MRQLAPLLMGTMLIASMTMAAPIPQDASPPKVPADKGVPAADPAAIKNIEAALKKLDPAIQIETITPSPMQGAYLVSLKGGRILYASPDGKHLIGGDMLEVGEKGLTNLTQDIRQKTSAKLLKDTDEKELIIFSPEGKTKGVVYAFTDVDCGYCRKLHQEIPKMNELGIEVRYLAYPFKRGGEYSPSYPKMVDVWCAKDRKQAMTDLKSSKPIKVDADNEQRAACKAIVDKQYELGTRIGVSGTPNLVLESGQLIPGYRPAAELARIMEITPAPPPKTGTKDTR